MKERYFADMGSVRLCFLALLLCGAATGCEWFDETASFCTVPVEPYRRRIEQGRPQPWTTTPRRIVKHLIPPLPEDDFREAGPRTYQQIRHLNGSVTISVTERLLDDEVNAERRVFTFVTNHGQWALQQVKVGYNFRDSALGYSGHCAN